MCFKNRNKVRKSNEIQKENQTYLPMTAIPVLCSGLVEMREYLLELIYICELSHKNLDWNNTAIIR